MSLGLSNVPMTRKEYNQCVESYADGVYRFILKQMRDVEKARDIVQESFAKVWQKVEEVNSEKAKAYLYTTAYRTMIDQIRKDERIQRLEPHHHSFSSVKNAYSDLKEVLDEALEKLPSVQKSVLLLRDYEGYSYDEIGQITGLGEAQVKVYIFRARMSLRNYISCLDTVMDEH